MLSLLLKYSIDRNFTEVVGMLRLSTAIFLTLSSTIAEAACPDDSTDVPRYSFGIVPQLPAEQIFGDWTPVLDQIGSDIGACFTVMVETTIPEFEQALNAGTYDFAFANPFHAVIAHEQVGYSPIIVDSRRQLNGILVVRADSNVTSLADLEGMRVVFPAPNAFGASLLTRQDLRQNNVNVDVEYVGTHSNVYRQVALGMAVAGGGVNNTLVRENDSLRERLRVLHQTRAFPAHPILAHPDVPEDVAAAFQTAMLAFAQRPDAEVLLQAIQIPEPRPADYQIDYAPIAELRLQELAVAP